VHNPGGLNTAIPLDMTGNPCGTDKLSGKSGKFLIPWSILFISTKKSNARHVAALLPVLSNAAEF
jgi:hypothetical protein